MLTPGSARARCGACCSLLAGAALGCSVGQGTGFVHSDLLFANDCYTGEFNLNPDFFGANPYGDTLTIRVQRGEEEVSVSDGLTLLVNDVPDARMHLYEQLPVGLPKGVSPIGFPLPEIPSPPAASMSLYLNNSCRGENSVLTAYQGYVLFEQLFSGDPNEENSEDRVTRGSLDVMVIDPRDAVPASAVGGGPSYKFPEERASRITAGFSFVFHRGTPAQPFP
jgi:hypothetical protein